MENAIEKIVHRGVSNFANGFEAKHLDQLGDPEGIINAKVHNTFMAALGDEVRFYSALSRSLDSSLGNMVEGIAIEIAELNFEVSRQVEGRLYDDQTRQISSLLERYKNSADALRPSVSHYQDLRLVSAGGQHTKRHDSDYVLKHKSSGVYSLIELKLGGDLDNKKARSEKEALLEQYCILASQLPASTEINIYFATGYNKFGENKPWNQGRVLQFFAKDELLISSDFWNFVADDGRGYEMVMASYQRHAHLIQGALERVKAAYLG